MASDNVGQFFMCCVWSFQECAVKQETTGCKTTTNHSKNTKSRPPSPRGYPAESTGEASTEGASKTLGALSSPSGWDFQALSWSLLPIPIKQQHQPQQQQQYQKTPQHLQHLTTCCTYDLIALNIQTRKLCFRKKTHK